MKPDHFVGAGQTNDRHHSSIGYRAPAQARRDMTIAQAALGEKTPGPDFGVNVSSPVYVHKHLISLQTSAFP